MTQSRARRRAEGLQTDGRLAQAPPRLRARTESVERVLSDGRAPALLLCVYRRVPRPFLFLSIRVTGIHSGLLLFHAFWTSGVFPSGTAPDPLGRPDDLNLRGSCHDWPAPEIRWHVCRPPTQVFLLRSKKSPAARESGRDFCSDFAALDAVTSCFILLRCALCSPSSKLSLRWRA